MKYLPVYLILAAVFSLFIPATGNAQMFVTGTTNANLLAQRLVGEGVIISNAKLTQAGVNMPAGLFSRANSLGLGIDSGIVLTSGRAASDFRNSIYGVNGNGSFKAFEKRADTDLDLPGDNSLAAELLVPPTDLFDAIALEFDFIPLGDSIRFKYVMSSEEYTPEMVCVYNDAFGFFVSGPGITGEMNIALIPGTNIPVAIKNVNNIPGGGCISFPQYYTDKTASEYFVHEGHTTVFTAVAKVVPCNKYHLKLVIADVGDNFWDSAVFIEAGSLSSNTISLTAVVQTDPGGSAYLAEGCTPGKFIVRRPKPEVLPLEVTLSYRGTVINGADIQLLPAKVTIPANENEVSVNINTIPDGIGEGIETLEIFALAGCGAGTASDSITIQLRDYDILLMQPDTIGICRERSAQLSGPVGYSGYSWSPAGTLDDASNANPVATPAVPKTFYYLVASNAECQSRDSVLVEWIEVDLRIFAGNDTVIATGQQLQLRAEEGSSYGITHFTWSPPDFLNNPHSSAPVTSLPHDFKYTVSATSAAGCTASDDIVVKVFKGPEIYVPTAFTPNGDGRNDILRALPAGIKELRHFSLFNRWGQRVFTTNNAAIGWDGRLNGILQPTGSFVWVAEAVDYLGNYRTYKGMVTLIR